MNYEWCKSLHLNGNISAQETFRQVCSTGQCLQYWVHVNGTDVTVSRPYSIPANMFVGDMVIPDTVSHNGIVYSVSDIDAFAFEQCTELTSVTIPASVTHIGEGAFVDCSGLISIFIPSSVICLGYGGYGECESYPVFSGCTSLTSIVVDANNPEYDSRNGCNAIIKTSTNT